MDKVPILLRLPRRRDRGWPLFRPPTPEQLRVVKKRQSYQRRQAAQPDPPLQKTGIAAQRDEEPWYAQ